MDHQSAWTHRAMKRNKELYVSAIMALAMRRGTQQEWFFTKSKQDPPDGLIGTPVVDSESGGNIMSVRELEIVEHFSGSVIDTITTKLNTKHKRYEPNTALVCLLSPKDLESYNFRELSKNLQKIPLPLQHIFAVFHGTKMSELRTGLSEQEAIRRLSSVTLIQFLPEYNEIIILPADCCRTFIEGKEKGWLRFEGRGRNPGFSDVTLDKAPILFD